MQSLRSFAAVGLAALLNGSALAQALPYHFVLNSQQSGLSGTLNLTVGTTGTLVGNYDLTNNPTGTRTKPGLYGSFGDTENVAVPLNLSGAIGGPIASSSAGMFDLELNPQSQTVMFSSFSPNLLASGPVALDLTVTLDPDSFRTRSPTSTYIGIPITLPVGQATLSELSAEQIGSAPGTLTNLGGGHYTFSVTPIVQLTATVDLLGNVLTLPGTPGALLLEGDIYTNGTSALLTSVRALEWSNSVDPEITLPQFPLDLPTIIPPGDTAHLLLDQVVNQLATNLQGTLTTNANGTLVPEPSGLLAVLAAGLLLRRR